MGKSMAQPFAPFLPLTFTHNSWQYSTVYDGNSNAVCRLDLEDWGVTEDNQDTLEVVQQQYAAFIVRACNSHDALVKALEDSALHLDSAQSGFISGCGSDVIWNQKRDEIVKDAREALAKVSA